MWTFEIASTETPWKRCAPGDSWLGRQWPELALSADDMLRLTALSEQGRSEVWYSSEAVVVGRLGEFELSIMKKKAESLRP